MGTLWPPSTLSEESSRALEDQKCTVNHHQKAAAFLGCVCGNAVSALREVTLWFPRTHVRSDLGIGHMCPEAAEGPKGDSSFFLDPLPHCSFLSCTLYQDQALAGPLIIHALSHYLDGFSCPLRAPLVPIMLHFPMSKLSSGYLQNSPKFSFKTLIFETALKLLTLCLTTERPPQQDSLGPVLAEGLASSSVSAQISPIWPCAYFIVTSGLAVGFLDYEKPWEDKHQPCLLFAVDSRPDIQ